MNEAETARAVFLTDKDNNTVLPITNADCVYVEDDVTVQDVIDEGIASVMVDDEMSLSSENPVKNKAIYEFVTALLLEHNNAQYAHDGVVHISQDEQVSGDKTFDGNTLFEDHTTLETGKQLKFGKTFSTGFPHAIIGLVGNGMDLTVKYNGNNTGYTPVNNNAVVVKKYVDDLITALAEKLGLTSTDIDDLFSRS